MTENLNWHDVGIEIENNASLADAYRDAVKALNDVRGGPLSTTLGFLIRAGYLVPASPTVTESAEYAREVRDRQIDHGVEPESSPEESPSPQQTKPPHGPPIPVGLIADQYHTMDVNGAIRALTNVGTVTISQFTSQAHRGQIFARLNNTGHDIAAGPAWSFTDVLNELYCRWQWAQGWKWDRIYGAGGGNYHWGWVERSEDKFRTSGDPL